MKNKIKVLGVIAVIAILGFTMTACGGGGGGDGGDFKGIPELFHVDPYMAPSFASPAAANRDDAMELLDAFINNFLLGNKEGSFDFEIDKYKGGRFLSLFSGTVANFWHQFQGNHAEYHIDMDNYNLFDVEIGGYLNFKADISGTDGDSEAITFKSWREKGNGSIGEDDVLFPAGYFRNGSTFDITAEGKVNIHMPAEAEYSMLVSGTTTYVVKGEIMAEATSYSHNEWRSIGTENHIQHYEDKTFGRIAFAVSIDDGEKGVKAVFSGAMNSNTALRSQESIIGFNYTHIIFYNNANTPIAQVTVNDDEFEDYSDDMFEALYRLVLLLHFMED